LAVAVNTILQLPSNPSNLAQGKQFPDFSYLSVIPEARSFYLTDERKVAILFAATILAARKLIDLDPDKPNLAKRFFVDRAIEDAAFILEQIDARWPSIANSFSAKES
jgi:hypothetical protein